MVDIVSSVEACIKAVGKVRRNTISIVELKEAL
jgi:hypothetical protein